MRTPDYDMLPALELWRLQRQNPNDPQIAKAVTDRDIYHKKAQRQNEVDQRLARDRRMKMRELYAY